MQYIQSPRHETLGGRYRLALVIDAADPLNRILAELNESSPAYRYRGDALPPSYEVRYPGEEMTSLSTIHKINDMYGLLPGWCSACGFREEVPCWKTYAGKNLAIAALKEMHAKRPCDRKTIDYIESNSG